MGSSIFQETAFGVVEITDHPLHEKPRRIDGKFLPTLPRCPKCGQPVNELKNASHEVVVRFNGSDYAPVDNPRLAGQALDIFQLMQDGEERSLSEIEELTGYPQASISAQLRHLRKPRHGSHKVTKTNYGNGLFKYKLEVNPETKDKLIYALKEVAKV
jgi:transcription initiation factor IIE alpha subunit